MQLTGRHQNGKRFTMHWITDLVFIQSVLAVAHAKRAQDV
jgi:hypothetical protein